MRIYAFLTVVVTASWTAAVRADGKASLPNSHPPCPVIARIDKEGQFVLRLNSCSYQPKQTEADGKVPRETVYEPVWQERTLRLAPGEVRVYDASGKGIGSERLPVLLKKETTGLYFYGREIDPLHLRAIKDGTLLFLHVPQPVALGPGPVEAANAPVPGLADFLKKQEYVAVPLERVSDYLVVRVRAKGKDLRLVVDTGAPNSALDRHRVRNLGLEWDETGPWCDLDGIEIGAFKTAPSKVWSHDMTEINRALCAYNSSPIDGVLGAEILKPLSAVIDHGGAVLYLRKAADPIDLPEDVERIDGRRFSMPLTFGAGASERLASVRLFVSEDRGKSWQPEREYKPTDNMIHFVAPRDGLYWFALQFVWKDGKKEPEQPDALVPQMKVYVHTGLRSATVENRITQKPNEVDELRRTAERLEKRIAELESRQRER